MTDHVPTANGNGYATDVPGVPAVEPAYDPAPLVVEPVPAAPAPLPAEPFLAVPEPMPAAPAPVPFAPEPPAAPVQPVYVAAEPFVPAAEPVPAAAPPLPAPVAPVPEVAPAFVPVPAEPVPGPAGLVFEVVVRLEDGHELVGSAHAGRDAARAGAAAVAETAGRDAWVEVGDGFVRASAVAAVEVRPRLADA